MNFKTITLGHKTKPAASIMHDGKLYICADDLKERIHHTSVIIRLTQLFLVGAGLYTKRTPEMYKLGIPKVDPRGIDLGSLLHKLVISYVDWMTDPTTIPPAAHPAEFGVVPAAAATVQTVKEMVQHGITCEVEAFGKVNPDGSLGKPGPMPEELKKQFGLPINPMPPKPTDPSNN